MIGKLTIDKSSMNISYFLYTLMIISNNNGIISRKKFVQEMAAFVGVPAIKDGKENRTAYNKSKMVRYFGFADVVVKNENEQYLVLTNRGKTLLPYIKDNGEQSDAENRYSIIPDCRNKFVDLIFDSVIFDSFGKNNSGAEQSNTDVEPPKVVFKTLLELGKATSYEICHVLYGLNRGVYKSFEEAIESVKKNRARDYTKLNEEWGITNIADDCKIIDIFTDSSIQLIVCEKDEEDGKKYYRLSSALDASHRKQIQQISVVYQPVRLFTYSKGSINSLSKWIDSSVLGRVSDDKQVVRFDWSSISTTKFCSPNDGAFEPCVFEKAVLSAYNNERKNIYIVLRNVSEEGFFLAMTRYSSLLQHINEFVSDRHGWSKEEIEDAEFYQYLINNCSNARKILSKNKVRLPSNLHIVGSIIMSNSSDIKFDYEFQRCLVDTGEEAEAKLTPEWFKAHADEFEDVRIEAETQYDEFQSKFAPEVLATLSGEELLRKMFYSGDSNKDNLCYYLEFHTKVRELFGSVAGGSAFKFNLFYQKKKSSWVTGSSAKPKLLTLDEAIVLGTEIRDALVKGAEIIKAHQDVSDADGYNKLYTQLFATMGRYINLLWVQKYYHMIFPDMFPVFYNEAWQRHVLNKLDIEPYDSGFVRMGQISLFVNKCDIENVVFAQIIYKYLNMVEDEDTDNDDSSDATEENEDKNVEEVRPFIELNFTTNIDCDFERNRIVFGAPGTGKSFQMEEDRAKLVEMGGGYERVTFHPDYTYSSFVGCYKPVSENGKIEYKYVPGPFMRVLVEALRSGLTDNPKPYLLVIEEINRAKVAAVFGEVFQLLDRDSKGTSDYEIHTSEDVKKYLSDELKGSLESFARIRIPNNMFIWASMNSADQGVFPMDTAFKRRWSFEYKGIDENEDKVGGLITLGTGEHEFEVNWNVLRKAINEVLAKKFNINEDKLMGPFFISEDVFAFDENGYIKNPDKFKRVFKSKVIMYLYEDAAKQQKHKLFSGCDSTKYSSICKAFDEIGIEIFGADFKDTYNDLR